MKNSYKFALLAALGLASVSAVQAQNAVTGDLIVGVYDPTVANTDVIDLGSATSLFSGETWTLSSLGLSGAGFGSTLSSGTQFGVVGDTDNGDNTSLVYSTGAATNTKKINGYSAWGARDGGLTGVPLGAQTAGSATAWDQEVQPVNANTWGAGYGLNSDDPVTSSAQFWLIEANNTNPTKDGTFSLNAATEVLTYNGVSVPEPTTYGLLAGAGLLIVSLRNQFSRKQA